MTNPEWGWVSVPAVAWALDRAPDVPASMVSTLVAVARHANQDGRNAHPAVDTIARATRKSERQVQRDLARLRSLGLLLPGDPRAVAHLPADRRPAVFDLPLRLARGDVDDTPQSERGDAHDTSRGDVDDATGCHPRPSGVTPMTPKESLKNPLKNPSEKRSLSGAATMSAAAAPPESRERDQPDPKDQPQDPEPLPIQLLRQRGRADPTADPTADRAAIEREYPGRGPGWWRTIAANGDLDEILKQINPSAAGKDTWPDWCGRCDQRTRKILVEGGYGQGMIPARCPRCSPLRDQPLNGQRPPNRLLDDTRADPNRYDDEHMVFG
jgi:hypothetical protein